MCHKRWLWAIPKPDPKPKPDKPEEKPPKFYSADDVKTPFPNRRKPKLAKLRDLIDDLLGRVILWGLLILLAGRFMGKSVVCLKHLSSGLLLFIGPFKVNAVPLRRVNQSYVIGTFTKIDIFCVNVEKFDDKYFAKEAKSKKKKTEGEFFDAEKEEKNVILQEKKDDQRSVDSQVLKAIEAVPDLKAYLGARFTLGAGVKPEELKF